MESTGCYIGLDIGGTKTMVKAIDSNGNKIALYNEATPLDYNEGISLLHTLIEKAAANYHIKGIGAAIGGPLDADKGIVSPLHQPQWRNIPLKRIMEERWQCPFYVDVDTNVAAIAEYYLGNYQASRFLYITLSTGMGGGFLIDGKIYQGLSHPEIAHQAISHCYDTHDMMQRISCECGTNDCLEAMVSGNGIKRLYLESAENLNEKEWSEVGYNLGQGLRNIATILSPEIIVFGGGVALGGGQALLDHAQKVLNEKLKLVKAPKLVLSQLGYNTALEGALCFAKGMHLPQKQQTAMEV
ncbi:ROK family protein [Cysteiniphilum litorale]|uniref:ROK family protein n=1 Tax=Cysteiniphilum litorale TaxID=2056700 RepID=UPI003F884303